MRVTSPSRLALLTTTKLGQRNGRKQENRTHARLLTLTPPLLHHHFSRRWLHQQSA
ncbi:hypothetical protein KCP70_21125 [Salmonella enterica subsp. enterica]|nr:hypothetical protein KCP70_21125 [Salmonella enterica subsp. enterica]